jgi:hypothetical protein
MRCCIRTVFRQDAPILERVLPITYNQASTLPDAQANCHAIAAIAAFNPPFPTITSTNSQLIPPVNIGLANMTNINTRESPQTINDSARAKIHAKRVRRRSKKREKRKSERQRMASKGATAESPYPTIVDEEREDYGIWPFRQCPHNKREKRALFRKRQKQKKYGPCPMHDKATRDPYPMAYRQWANWQVAKAMETLQEHSRHPGVYTIGDAPCTCSRKG